MKTTYIQSTTIHVLPTLYFRTNPLTLGMGWLGQSIEFSQRVELTISSANVERWASEDTTACDLITEPQIRGEKPNPRDYKLPEDYYSALLAYEENQGMSEIEREERVDAAKTQDWINKRFLIKARMV
jgi:hypothetical protein